jgi:hypothetical protein
MMICSSSLSWDGVLCDLCRQTFDSRHRAVSRWRSEPEPWHNQNAIKQCASNNCHICRLVHANVEQFGAFQSLETPMTIRWADLYGRDGYELSLYYPDTDGDGRHISKQLVFLKAESEA